MRSRILVAVVSCLVTAAVVGGFAVAAIPQSVTTQITTCYPKTGATKTLRVIDYQAGQRCTANENTLSWQANGLHWRGAWSSSTLYAKHDVVASGGSSYVAILGGVNHAPPNSAYWAVLAAQGPIGPQGPVGPRGKSGKSLPTPSQIGQLAWYPTVTATVVVGDPTNGAHPRGVAFDGTNIWVANNGPNLSKIDPDTNAVLANVSVGGGGYGVAFDGEHIWVAAVQVGGVSKIDPVSNSVVATIPIDGGCCSGSPTGVAFDGSSIWVAKTAATPGAPGSVTRIDPISNAIVATVPVDANPFALAWDGAHVWVANSDSGSLSKIDPATNAVITTMVVGGSPYGLAFDGTNLWVTNATSQNVKKIDQVTNTVLATISLAGGCCGSTPLWMAFDGTSLWVTKNDNQGAVWKIDPRTNTVIAKVATGSQPHGVAFDGINLWVTNTGPGTVTKIRP